MNTLFRPSLYSVCVVAVSSLFYQAFARPLVAPSPIPSFEPTATYPSWAHKKLGNVNFDYSDDLRTASDFHLYQINPQGEIRANELLNISDVKDFEVFKKAVIENGFKGDVQKFYSEYLQERSNQAIAALVLSRIIDHEAMKLKLTPSLREVRLNYFINSILFRNAWETCIRQTLKEKKIELKKGEAIPEEIKAFCEDFHKGRSYDELYLMLKARLVDKNDKITFNIDWTFTDLGLAQELEKIKKGKDVSWSNVRITFIKEVDHLPEYVRSSYTRLPDTYFQFRKFIEDRLIFEHAKNMRTDVWHYLVSKHNPGIYMENLFAISDRDLAKHYLLKAVTATVSDLVVTGSKAKDFQARFQALYLSKQKNLQEELEKLVGNDPTAPDYEARMKEARARLFKERETLPGELVAQLKQEFASELAAGALKLEFHAASRMDALMGASPMPQQDPWVARKKKAVFSDFIFESQLLPKLDLLEENATDATLSTYRVMLLVKAKSRISKTQYDLDKNGTLSDAELDVVARQVISGIDEIEVKPALEASILSKVQAFAFRKTADHLMRKNRFVVENDTCTAEDSAWGCLNTRPGKMAEILFPEEHYPAELKTSDVENESSFRNRSVLSDVMAISLDGLGLAFSIQNKYWDPATTVPEPETPKPVQKKKKRFDLRCLFKGCNS